MDYRIDDVIHIRVLVLTLGESQHANWWSSQFLSPTGISFLERLYPRSKFAVAVRSAGQAAMLIHDAKIGKGAVFHLFRLPKHIEMDVDDQLSQRSAEFEAIYAPILAKEQELLKALSIIAGDYTPIDAVGPIQVNSTGKQWVDSMAAYYLKAFVNRTQVFPYFEDSRVSV
jgi:hypothetical protein